MSKERLEAWFAGRLPDHELTSEEVAWLEKATFKAVKRKLEAEGRCAPSTKSLH